jgi:hypothetical protein
MDLARGVLLQGGADMPGSAAAGKSPREKHDPQDEPAHGFPEKSLCNAAGIIGSRPQVAQNHRRGPPEWNKGQHDRGGNHSDLFMLASLCTFIAPCSK